MLDKENNGCVLALGYFDSVHLGHRSVITEAVNYAKKLNAKSVVVTFEGNLRAFVGGDGSKTVFNATEREKFIKDLGVDEIYFAPITPEFLSMSGRDFLDHLNEKYSVIRYVSGEDYKFGSKASGTVESLIAYAKEHNQDVVSVPTLLYNGERISTTSIKGLLTNGEILAVNNLLGRKYSVTGTVFSDRKVGTSIGFPTVNIKIDKDKHRLKDGVYAGEVEIQNKVYKTVINYGARPTFDLNEKLLEAHIIDFSGSLYGQTLTIKFDRFLRDIIKFNRTEDLVCQLKKDTETVKGNI